MASGVAFSTYISFIRCFPLSHQIDSCTRGPCLSFLLCFSFIPSQTCQSPLYIFPYSSRLFLWYLSLWLKV
ncbi:hypothetical protein EV426DRAFT_434331 [Tirmania nivea]|nr:hypothetical protein EV426DRAFT_434331 [Tirmania nivea]